MRKILCNKQYSGILWAIFVASLFVIISLLGTHFFNRTLWYFFSTTLRFAFGFIILLIAKKLYGSPIKQLLSIKGSKMALIAGSGFLFFLLYYIILWCLGIKSIKGLTIGILISRIILQQIATGFYEELNYRFLIAEGYFYGPRSIKNKLMYGFISFFLFATVHIVDGWSTSRFLLTGSIGFAFVVIYLRSRNIVIPMVLHFIYDVFANLADYIKWNNSTLFVNMNSLSDISLIIMFVTSAIMLLKKENR